MFNAQHLNISIYDTSRILEGETLLEYMYAMEEEGEIEFSLSNGMITAINGTENAATYNPCWMLYTSDTEYSNGAWGSYEHEGQTLFSATLGASELPAKSGEIYVWVYQSF